MSNETFIKNGPQFLFADHSGEFGSAPATAANSQILAAYTPVDVEFDPDGLAASGGGWESAKCDLGADGARGTIFRFDACIEFASGLEASDNDSIDFYWAATNKGAAGTGQPGGTSGTNAAYTDSPGSLAQLTKIGSLVCRGTVFETGNIGWLTPDLRWGSLVCINNADQNFFTTMDETHVVATPVIYVPGT